METSQKGTEVTLLIIGLHYTKMSIIIMTELMKGGIKE